VTISQFVAVSSMEITKREKAFNTFEETIEEIPFDMMNLNDKKLDHKVNVMDKRFHKIEKEYNTEEGLVRIYFISTYWKKVYLIHNEEYLQERGLEKSVLQAHIPNDLITGEISTELIYRIGDNRIHFVKPAGEKGQFIKDILFYSKFC
jgi:hypothetical protein